MHVHSAAEIGKRRVLIVDDRPIVREHLTELVTREPDLTVRGDVDDPHGAFQRDQSLKKFLRLLFLVVWTWPAITVLQAQSVPPRPNIIVILADDLGYGDVSFNGCPDYLTPNIDSLATNGIWCSNGYVTHPFCSPSRASLPTGRYQQRFGHGNQPEGDQSNPRQGLPMQELLLPQIVKPAGYVCGAIGKWHLGTAPNMRPLQRGFDEFFGFLGSGSPYFNASVLQNNTLITETAYLTDAFTREGVSFINRHATEPFFLYLAYNAVHVPYDTPPASYMDRVANISDPERQLYAAMVTALDDGVGQVLHALQAQNLLDKTLIFFLSDNGAPLNNFARNFPLRGGKLTFWEGVFACLSLSSGPAICRHTVSMTNQSPLWISLLQQPLPPAYHCQPTATMTA